MSHQDRCFPNEAEGYREAREQLLQAEIDLRSQIEKVAAARTWSMRADSRRTWRCRS